MVQILFSFRVLVYQILSLDEHQEILADNVSIFRDFYLSIYFGQVRNTFFQYNNRGIELLILSTSWPKKTKLQIF